MNHLLKTAVMIDGGYLREILNAKRGYWYYPKVEEIEKFCTQDLVKRGEEMLYRVFFYDAKPSEGDVEAADYFYNCVSYLPFFALRLGRLVNRASEGEPPKWVQKGVDMKIGIDIASLAYKGLVERIVLVTNDTDLIPALKLARINGIQIRVVNLDSIHNLFKAHADMHETLKVEDFFPRSLAKKKN